MSLDERDKLNKLEALKRKLFTKSYEVKVGYHDTFPHHPKNPVPDSWDEEEKKEESKIVLQTSMFKKFFIFSIVFFLIALGYVAFTFFRGGNTVSNENIEITVLGNSFTDGGEDLPLIIEILNKNNSPLELADLVVEYPKGGLPGSVGQVERLRESLGTISAGAVRSENLKVVLFGEQGSVHPIKISLEYRVEGSNSIFVKEKVHEVSISATPIEISVDAPSEISPNEDITINVNSFLNATKPASKVLIKVDYPFGFEFVSAKPAPAFGNNIWDLGDISPGADMQISITGKMVDVFDGEEKTFRVFAGSQLPSDKSAIGVVFNSMGHSVLIKKPFIEAKLFVNGSYSKEYAIKGVTQVEVRWQNNLETTVNDFQIVAKLSGNALDRKMIKSTTGFYNSSQDSIIWDKNSDPKFEQADPGESGSVQFSVSPLALMSAGGGVIPDPVIKIEVSVNGKQPLEGYATKNLNNFETKTLKVISDVGFISKALHYSGPITNKGPIPPKVEQETTYTIVWSLSNTSNRISRAEIRSKIPQWVKFVGAVSPAGENLIYDSTNREIVWRVGAIPRGTSVTELGKEVAFQIAFTPSIPQIDTSPVLLEEAVLTGHDDFANVDVRLGKNALTTRLSGDPAFPISGAKVVE